MPVSLNKEIRLKLAEVYTFKFFFKLVKPKAIFVLSSFTKVGIVIAAKELGIKVYEAQHGFMGDSHPFYSAKKHFKEAYPDYLLSFGTYEKQNKISDLIFSSNQIIPIGSFQLELIKNHTTHQELLNLKDDYQVIFCVTLQAIKEEKILNWVSKEAEIHKDWLFVLRPKNRDFDYSDSVKKSNVVLLNDFTIYEVLKISDYNITIFSTTAVEGVFLGAQPIFYNINNLSREYFDIEKMQALLIEEGEMIDEEQLGSEKKMKQSFFIEDYMDNVKNTELCF
jgi:hypothetical protein